MIIASGPYISPHFAATVRRNGWLVVDAGDATAAGMDGEAEFMEHANACSAIRERPNQRILTNSENALAWFETHLAETQLAKAAQLFKDKAAFRRLLQPAFPEFQFVEVSLAELSRYEPPADIYPFVIKPSVGFFSIAVHRVDSPSMWPPARESILREIPAAAKDFPAHVLSRKKLLIESCIQGDEYAVDAYFDGDGMPVILNIMEHRFASGADVSDRLYLSSRRIIESVIGDAREFLERVNRHAGIRNFPLHAEFRRSQSGRLTPIEINPLRFGGFCTTGDFAHFAWGLNSYEYFMNDAAPDWESVFQGREDREFALIVLENSTDLPFKDIRAFDYDALLKRFSKPIHLAKLDFTRFPLFGFLFIESSPPGGEELDWILQTDLSEFVTRRD